MTEPLKPKELHLDALKNLLESAIMAVPGFQRRFVWNATRLRDLADSIFKGYSIGTFTIWDASKTKEKYLRHLKGYLLPYDSKNNSRIHYVIDGQQRLITLWSFLRPDGLDITNDNGANFNSKNICFSIKKDENGLNFNYVKKGPDNKKYFSLCDILSDKFKERFYFLIKQKQIKKLRKIQECRKRFLNYPLVFVYLKKDIEFNNIRETFIRLNIRGMTLKSADRNYSYATKVNLRELIDRAKEKLGIFRAEKIDAQIQELIYAIFKDPGKSYRFSSPAIGKTFQRIDDDPKLRSKFIKEWKKICTALARTEKFLKGQGVKSIHFLPSVSMISVLAIFYYYYGRDKLSLHINNQLKKWFWYSAVSGRYSGGGYYSNASKDIELIKDLANGKYKEFKDFEIIDKHELDAQYYDSKSSLVKSFYCLLALREPREFFNGDIRIDLNNPTYRDRKENHHIFPKDIMYGVVTDKKINSIINICFLPKHTNASFSRDPPYEYLKSNGVDKININKILTSHVIPLIVKTKIGPTIKYDFNDFYEKRKKILIKNFENEAGIKLFE